MDPVVAEECLPSFCVGNDDELHRPFGRGEISGHFVRMYVSQNKAHVSLWDVDEDGHVAVACNRGGVPRCIILDRKYHDYHERDVYTLRRGECV